MQTQSRVDYIGKKQQHYSCTGVIFSFLILDILYDKHVIYKAGELNHV
jgi:hypothetical protein